MADAVESSSEYAAQALEDEKNALQKNDFTSFDKRWAYAGTDLGFNYSPTSTTFKIWSPTATSVKLISYGKNNSPTAPQVSSTLMTRGTSATPDNHATNTIGVWSLTIPGDQNGMVYVYELTFANGTISDYSGSTYGTLYTSLAINTTNDPYSIATTQGGNRSVVVSPESITSNLVLAQGDSATWRVAVPTQAVVDELHIRDFTISPTSGVSEDKRGKYLGVIQSGTTNPNTGTATGLDYLKNEGFNYVQIMPSSQYSSVDESGNRTPEKPNNYNWGYDPQNEMVPEGEYASESINPVTRIIEMKSMVQGLHVNGIGVIMDMVFNHVSDQGESPFEKSVPGYYFRKYTQSGCGNDTASDHEMFGKFIIDAVIYWAKNYDIDGFRFDLMSLLDSNTMNKLRAALMAIDPRIIMYGEGWQDSNANNIPETSINNAKKVLGIGFFNPSERDAIVNNEGNATGLASGNTTSTTNVASALLGSGGWNGNASLQDFGNPSQSVNYIECHDGYTVSDSLWLSNPNDSVATHQARVAFANATNILANGITFMEAGQEFNRTKLVNPSNLTPLSPTQTQAYQSGSMQKPAWYSASWDTAKNSYNGLFALDSNGNYHGNYWPGNNLGTVIVAGDVVNGINWDNVKDNQSAVNFIGDLIKFKKSNPQFWPDEYGYLAWTPTQTGAEKVTNASNGVITEELTFGSTKYLVVFNASGNSVTIGQGGQFYGDTNLTGKTVIISNDSSLTANQPLNSSVTMSNLTVTIIKLS
ncbi:type I pullulanase [Weissella confusa]|uniref:type I pullulanase n=1 Tax=Weissella confusa TaxID=1583 RepID=UPI0014366CED|nr:type I pullulanase [Weissella confusa]MBJ7654841.1 type I pullulanase [Weissella confusa]